MSNGLFNLKKALNVFGTSPEVLESRGVHESSLPAFARSLSDNRTLKSWSLTEMPQVGEKVGFMKKPSQPVAVAVFVTKGGVLKSSLTLNLARLAALHNIKTCVVGLDMQGDITTALSQDHLPDEDSGFEEALERMNSLRGLPDVFSGEATLSEVIQPTDIPTLSFIPETPELVALDQSLMNKNRREYWLREKVVAELKRDFDLILMDCSPNWNRLITNALMACDTLISPLECKINNFRNFKTFRVLIREFKEDMGAEFGQVFVPTRIVPGRRLSQEIFQWYQTNLSACSRNPIRESTQGEESVALRISIPEHAPTSVAAEEMRDVVQEIWSAVRTEANAGERIKGNESAVASAKRRNDLSI